jgi:hypothetical protein
LFGGGKGGDLYPSLHVHIRERLSAPERRLFAKLREWEKQTSSADATAQRQEKSDPCGCSDGQLLQRFCAAKGAALEALSFAAASPAAAPDNRPRWHRPETLAGKRFSMNDG